MKYYTVEILETMYQDKYPELEINTIRIKTKILHTQLNTLDMDWRRSNRRFYGNVFLYS